MSDLNRKRGDILEATDRTSGIHYIVYYNEQNETNFIGGMITHLENKKNKPMKECHFKIFDENGVKYKITYDKTNLVVAKLVKFESWGPFTKVGELTQEGIEFVINTIDKLNSETFKEYSIRTKIN